MATASALLASHQSCFFARGAVLARTRIAQRSVHRCRENYHVTYPPNSVRRKFSGTSSQYAHERAPTLPGKLSDSVSIYVHFPFCRQLCGYCAFNKFILPRASDSENGRLDRQLEQRLARAAVLELRYYWQAMLDSRALASLNSDIFDVNDGGATANRFGFGPTEPEALPPLRIASVYFGGGSPSIARGTAGGFIYEVMQEIRRLNDSNNHSSNGISTDAMEVTLEVDPQDRFWLSEFVDNCGVNRLSVGIQTLDNHDLQFLGRGHDASAAIECVRQARTLIEDVSVDLIYGRHSVQTPLAWRSELQQAIDVLDRPPHMSLYALGIEPNTPFHRMLSRDRNAKVNETVSCGSEPTVKVFDEDVALEFYNTTIDVARRNSYEHYEVSSFASLPSSGVHTGSQFRSRHNAHYWRGGDYIGVGPGACGRISLHPTISSLAFPVANQRRQERNESQLARYETKGHDAPMRWLRQVEKQGHGADDMSCLTTNEHFTELLILGLRKTSGISDIDLGAALRMDAPVEMTRFISMRAVSRLVEAGLLTYSANRAGGIARLIPTLRGLALGDTITVELLRG